MARTYQQQLDDLDSLIAQIEASPNQTIVILGRTFAKHQLKDLYDERRTLMTLAAREAAGGLVVSQVVPL